MATSRIRKLPSQMTDDELEAAMEKFAAATQEVKDQAANGHDGLDLPDFLKRKQPGPIITAHAKTNAELALSSVMAHPFKRPFRLVERAVEWVGGGVTVVLLIILAVAICRIFHTP